MTQLIIESVPSGAEVQIDGEIIGTTPLIYPIDETVGLAEFRDECLSGGNVVCSWDSMKTRLEDQTVSRLWWDLTRDERYSIGEKVIRNTMFFWIVKIRKGKLNCEGGEGEYEYTTCLDNAAIRYLKIAHAKDFIEGDIFSVDRCYWKHPVTGEEICKVPDVSYNLPCSIGQYESGHLVCALQIGQMGDKIDDFIIFQYLSFDIKPVAETHGIPEKFTICKPDRIRCRGLYVTTIVEFII